MWSHTHASYPSRRALWIITALLPLAIQAQDVISGDQRPSDRSLPTLEYIQPSPSLTSSPTMPPPQAAPLSARGQIQVRQFAFTGNTVFTTDELATVTAPYTGRAITAEELQEARRQLTLYYVERGYLNSGATIPEQSISDGVVHIQIIEGRLAEVDVTGNTHLRPTYFQDRLRPDMEEPLKFQTLQERLQLLQQDPLLAQIQAELAPGIRPGESVLRLGVRETSPYEIGFAIANNNPPSVGATRAYLYGLDRNLSGIGDSLGLSYGHSLESSTDDWRVFYARPLNAQDTTAQLWVERNETSVIEDRFDTLDITSTLETYGVSLTHPLYRTTQRTFSLGINLERRHSESYLMGIPFSFAPGEENGEATLAVTRLVQEWLDRRVDQVIAARSTFSFGLDAMGATIHDTDPDGQFIAWMGQFQWAQRFGERHYQVIFKSNLQLTNDPLLPMEKCALGGMDTIRGYPENTLVRDECFVASLELRAPVYRLPLPGVSRGQEEGQIQLAAFADYGHAKNKGVFDLDPNEIYSAGVGVRWDPGAKIRTALYWGYPFKEVDVGDKGWLSPRVNFFIQAAY